MIPTEVSDNICIHQSDRPVTGLACASPAPARPLVMQGVRRLEGRCHGAEQV
jgi:hypothetical protein